MVGEAAIELPRSPVRLSRHHGGAAESAHHDLDLVRNRNAIFAYSWTATHPIVAGSPLYGASPESLAASTAWIVVSLTGLDETLSQTVHARMYYGDEDIRWGARISTVATFPARATRM